MFSRKLVPFSDTVFCTNPPDDAAAWLDSLKDVRPGGMSFGSLHMQSSRKRPHLQLIFNTTLEIPPA